MSRWDQAAYLKAWNYATVKHHGQCYGGPNPDVKIAYVNHLASTAMELIWLFQTDTQHDQNFAIQCALLHDVIEDTDATHADVAREFGSRVADAVQALSKDESITDKKQKMLECLQRIVQQPNEVWMVKLADRITNLYHPPHYWQQPKIDSYKEESEWIYDALHTAHPTLAARLRTLIDDYGIVRTDMFPSKF